MKYLKLKHEDMFKRLKQDGDRMGGKVDAVGDSGDSMVDSSSQAKSVKFNNVDLKNDDLMNDDADNDGGNAKDDDLDNAIFLQMN